MRVDNNACCVKIAMPSMRDDIVIMMIDNDNTGVIEDVSEKSKTLARRFDPSIKEDIR